LARPIWPIYWGNPAASMVIGIWRWLALCRALINEAILALAYVLKFMNSTTAVWYS
jgi:hypothetical protein